MRCGLIGGRLGHSYSKAIHEQLADYCYELIPLEDAAFDPFMRKREFDAVNVTIPYKERVLPYLDWIDPAARRMGAVNTVVNRNGRLYGWNTDFAGARCMLKANSIDLRGKRVLVLGTGGTSKTLQAVCGAEGADTLWVASRTPGDGQVSYEQAARLDAQVVVNTTPCGMYPKLDQQPIDLASFPQLEAVVDVIYNPLRTQLLQQARTLGVQAVNGLLMLVAQAKYAAEHFLNQPLPEEAISRIHKQMCRDMTNLALIGMPSAGKTTVGKALAAQLGRPFVDLDAEIVREAGMDIPALFERFGEAHFRKIERTCLLRAAAQGGQVISTGGGAVKDARNVRALQQNSVLVLLERDLSQLAGDASRPLAPDAAAIQQLYRERAPLYRACCDARVDNSGPLRATLDAIKEVFHEIACT